MIISKFGFSLPGVRGVQLYGFYGVPCGRKVLQAPGFSSLVQVPTIELD